MTRAITIIDAEDPRIAAYRDIRERDLVGREGMFIAEGEVVVRVLFTRSLHPAVSLLVAEKRLDGLGEIVATVPDDVPVYSASQAVMDRVAGFPIHRGILAVGRRVAQPSPDAILDAAPRGLVVGLFGIANHDNMGGILRNAAAFGATAVILDSDCCDPLYRKAIRVSVGAALTVPTIRLDRGDDAIALLETHGYTTLALSPSGSRTLAEASRPARVAALFGTEGPGLPDAILDRVTTVRIPMAGTLDSLNVATSSGIVLHHLAFGDTARSP